MNRSIHGIGLGQGDSTSGVDKVFIIGELGYWYLGP